MPPPLHRAPDEGRRGGTRVKPSAGKRLPLLAGAAAATVAAVTAVAVLTGGDDPAPSATAAGPTTAPRPAATAGPSPTTSPEATPAAAASPAVISAPGTGGEAQPSAAVLAAVGPDRTPDALRVALEQVLASRAAANTSLLRGVLDEDTPQVTAAQAALDVSGADLERVLAVWGDPQLAGAVRSGLDEQSAAARAYAEAVRDGEPAVADRARGAMGEVSRALGRTLDGATSGRIATYVPPQDAGRLRAFVDALAAGDAAAAAEQEQWLRARLGREGVALAEGLTAA